METPTDNELLLDGLKNHLMRLNRLVNEDINQYKDDLMELDALIFSLTYYNNEIKNTLTRIKVVSSEKIDKTFAADDIPF